MTPEEQAVAIARMDENIGFIREQLERGIGKFKEIDNRLDKIKGVSQKAFLIATGGTSLGVFLLGYFLNHIMGHP